MFFFCLHLFDISAFAVIREQKGTIHNVCRLVFSLNGFMTYNWYPFFFCVPEKDRGHRYYIIQVLRLNIMPDLFSD